MFSRSKRHRVGSNSRLSSLSSSSSVDNLASLPNGFNDPSSADVILHLHLSNPNPNSNNTPPILLHLHSSSLHRSRYFAALLSPRWTFDGDSPRPITLNVPSFEPHIAVLKLLYSPVSSFHLSISTVSDAMDLLPVALELLYDDLISYILKFVESVPWAEEDEERILEILPLLSEAESKDIRARLFPKEVNCAEQMMSNLINRAIHSHPKVATVKAFVAKILRDYSDRDLVKKVLDEAFRKGLETVKELLGEYASPDFRVAGDNEEREAIQRLSLHKAVVNARHLLWIVERMIELRVADAAVVEWSEQGWLAADLCKIFKDDGWSNIAPGLPTLIMRCTGRLVNAVVAGSIIAAKEVLDYYLSWLFVRTNTKIFKLPWLLHFWKKHTRQVRMKLVKEWLPVLNVCRDIVSPMPSSHKILYQELEVTFLSIISTLPMPEAQELLQQCLGFSTTDVNECPHLVGAFDTWFRRANRISQDEDAS